MTQQLHNDGEIRVLTAGLQSRSVDIGLYNDSTDALADGAVYADITTEPSGSAYAAQSATGTNSISLNGNSNGEAVYADQTFDTSDSTQSVDSCYVRDSSWRTSVHVCARSDVRSEQRGLVRPLEHRTRAGLTEPADSVLSQPFASSVNHTPIHFNTKWLLPSNGTS